MVTSLVPINSSIIKNFQIVTEGGSYDNVACVFKQGVWLKGKLNGTTCRLTNYFDASLVNIREGVFSNGLENGTVYEYVFPKSSWSTFITNPPAGIDSTRYTQTFASGVWVSTSETLTNKKIKGLVTYNANGYPIGFTFSEV